jgi:hypothetical protein
MLAWVRALDRILRGESTRPSAIRGGVIDVPARGLSVVLIVLGLLYGFCMGWFGLFKAEGPEFRQLIASMIKVPALFLLTLLVTFPSLYVFNALVGSRLNLMAVLRLLLAALAVILAVLASFGPITAFFSVSTTSYPFMILLNVLLFTVAGLLGLAFLLQTLHRLSLPEPGETLLQPGNQVPPPEPGQSAPPENSLPPPEPPGALDWTEQRVLGPHVKAVFRCWIVVFALVGSQMGWVLRPFIGEPSMPVRFFRQDTWGNAYVIVLRIAWDAIGMAH